MRVSGELADGSGELLSLDAQLPEGAGALQGADRTRGVRCWGRSGSDGIGGEDSHEGEKAMGMGIGMNGMECQGVDGWCWGLRSGQPQPEQPRAQPMS